MLIVHGPCSEMPSKLEKAHFDLHGGLNIVLNFHRCCRYNLVIKMLSVKLIGLFLDGDPLTKKRGFEQ